MTNGDQQRLLLFSFILCAGVSYWFYVNLEIGIIHSWDAVLVNQSSGERRKLTELLNLTKIINYTRDYIEATNAEERLYDLKYQLDLEKPFVIEQHYSYIQDKLVSGWPVANQTQCGAQLDWILARLAEHANYTFLRGQLGFELTSLMDSFGRPEANTYAGIISWLGSYESCLRTSLDGGRIKTRYCEARMRPKWWPSDDVAPMIPPTRIRLGVCLPETCDTMSLEHHRPAIELLAKFQLPELYKSGLDMMDLFCLPDERSPIRQLPLSGRIFLAVAGSWLVLIAAGTIVYERCTRSQKKKPASISSMGLHHHQTKATTNTFETSEPLKEGSQLGWELVKALSLRCSLKTFKSSAFRVHYHLGHRVRVDLGCLDFFKIVMILLFIYSHACVISGAFLRNSVKRIQLYQDYRPLLAMAFGLFADTFFVIFGLLTTYTLMRKLNANQLANPSVWLVVNAERFLKIAPIFWLAYFYSRTISPYTSTGPWWDYGVDEVSTKGVCLHESWLKAIPYLGKMDTPPACNLVSWFITSYLQILLILPMLTYVLCKLPTHKLRFALTGFLMSASAINMAIRMYKQNSITAEGYTVYATFLVNLMEKFESTGHLLTFGRLRSTSIGCLLGYLLRQYELGDIPRWPKWLNSKRTLWLTAAGNVALLMLPLVQRWAYLKTRRLSTMNEIVAGHAVVLVAWPILNAILLLLLSTNYCHTAVVRFFSHPFWYSFNRLGLCIYLIHWEILWVLTTGFEQSTPYAHMSEVFRVASFGAVLSIVLSVLIHLLVEEPLSRLTTNMMQALFSGDSRKRKGGQVVSSDKRCSGDMTLATTTTTTTTTPTPTPTTDSNST